MTLRLAILGCSLVALAACNRPAPPAAAIMPSGIQSTGTAGMTGGSSAAPAGSGTLSTTPARP